MKKIDLKFLKKNFQLDRFIKSLNSNYKVMDNVDMLDRVIEGAYQDILDDDGISVPPLISEAFKFSSSNSLDFKIPSKLLE